MRLGGRPRQLAGRQEEIFEIVIGEFIKSARPVSSRFLAENYGFTPLRGVSRRERISSATIRNDLALLEELGFLTKPHTSGGRVPTSRGWHFFIEEVREPDEFSKAEATRLNALTDELLNTSQEMMNCVSKIFPEVSDEFFKKFLMEKLFQNYDRRK